MLAFVLVLALLGSTGGAPAVVQQGTSASPSPAHDGQAKEGQQSVSPQGGYALKVNVDSVFLNVSVRERTTNRSIAGLQKDDFLVYEDGVQQEVGQLLPTEAPFNLLLLLDVSGSTASYLHLMKEAAIDFTREIKADDRVAIVPLRSEERRVGKGRQSESVRG